MFMVTSLSSAKRYMYVVHCTCITSERHIIGCQRPLLSPALFVRLMHFCNTPPTVAYQSLATETQKPLISRTRFWFHMRRGRFKPVFGIASTSKMRTFQLSNKQHIKLFAIISFPCGLHDAYYRSVKLFDAFSCF